MRPVAKMDRAAAFELAVEHAILAPSSHNTQPWRFEIREDAIELYADRERALPVVDPHDRELVISCGAALFNLRTSLRHSGLEPRVGVVANEGQDLLARISATEPPFSSDDPEALFAAIARRHTNRRTFEDRLMSGDRVRELRDAAIAEGAELTILEGSNKEAAAELIADGDRIQAADSQFRRELAAWVHPSGSGAKDGIPASAMGVPALVSLVFPLILRTFDWGNGQAAKDRELAAGSPLLALISTDEDTPEAWIRAGQALERVLLTATAAGLAASFLNQPIEVPELRPRLAALAGIAGKPQILLRMGYGPAIGPTPRRDLAEVLARRRSKQWH